MSITQQIEKVRRAFVNARMADMRERARQKTDDERARAEIELIIDDIKAEGIEPLSPMGVAIFVEVAKDRLAKMRAQDRDDDDRDPFTAGLI